MGEEVFEKGKQTIFPPLLKGDLLGEEVLGKGKQTIFPPLKKGDRGIYKRGKQKLDNNPKNNRLVVKCKNIFHNNP
ncbi:hypothetical protein KAW96_10425 [candidate division WOR-3 bacterium]|nr:hypothetical protein [candidate division WOR-3 bacterium]